MEGSVLNGDGAQVLIALPLHNRDGSAVADDAVISSFVFMPPCYYDGRLRSPYCQTAGAHLHTHILGVDDGVFDGHCPGAGEVDAVPIGHVEGAVLQGDGVLHIGTVGDDAVDIFSLNADGNTFQGEGAVAVQHPSSICLRACPLQGAVLDGESDILIIDIYNRV